MKKILHIILILISLNSVGQTKFNTVSLDTIGLLKWNITFIAPSLRLEIQVNLSGNWTTIYKTGHNVEYFDEGDIPKNPVPTNILDSCIVPLDKGSNYYRIIMTSPEKLVSREVSANLFLQTTKNIIQAADNIIRFDNRVNFSINDSNGKEIRKPDYGRMINVSDLKNGFYYIIVDRRIYKFEKK